jgi:phosphoglycerate dehydrogenase-like enzyme
VKVIVSATAPLAEFEPLPPGIELVRVPGEGPLPAGVEEAELLVLDVELTPRLGELIGAAARLRVVQALFAGIEWVLPHVPAGITVCNTSGVGDGPVAEWVVGAILGIVKAFPTFRDAQRERRWLMVNPVFSSAGEEVPIELLEGKTALVIGHGAIGHAIERRLLPFGVTIVGVTRHAREGAYGPEAIPDLLPHADYVIVVAPLTQETRGLVDDAFLERMKNGALLVNASRGKLVDTDALVRALHTGRIRATLDVTDPEPLPDDHPLWRAPNVFITPHVAGMAPDWATRVYRFAGEQIRRAAAGEPLANVRTDY